MGSSPLADDHATDPLRTAPPSLAASAVAGVMWAMPLLFAFGFLMPLLLQIMEHIGPNAVLGVPNLYFSALVAGSWGIVAQITGRWI